MNCLNSIQSTITMKKNIQNIFSVTFKTNGSFTLTQATTVNILLVGGGGGGGGSSGGRYTGGAGGSGGAVNYYTSQLLQEGTYTATIGTGGQGGVPVSEDTDPSGGKKGSVGEKTSLIGPETNLTALGGNGGVRSIRTLGVNSLVNGLDYTSGYGGEGDTTNGVNGGNGIQVNAVYYAGGGGGGCRSRGLTRGTGGLGGGGDGGAIISGPGVAGMSNTGGGGGGDQVGLVLVMVELVGPELLLLLLNKSIY
jgi:hypothetical protein